MKHGFLSVSSPFLTEGNDFKQPTRFGCGCSQYGTQCSESRVRAAVANQSGRLTPEDEIRGFEIVGEFPPAVSRLIRLAKAGKKWQPATIAKAQRALASLPVKCGRR